MFICTKVAILLNTAVGQIVLPSTLKVEHYNVKTKMYYPQDNRFYNHQEQPANQDWVKETLPEMEILQIILHGKEDIRSKKQR